MEVLENIGRKETVRGMASVFLWARIRAMPSIYWAQ